MFFINSVESRTFSQKPNKNCDDLVNNLIRFPEVLLIGPDGQQVGVVSRNEALRQANEANLDLLCVAPNAKPPVCKILNYGKYRYEQQKKAKEAKKNQHIIETKEVRFTPQTDKHDLETKAKATISWLQAGNKVKVTVRFRGRQMAHPEIGEETLNQFIDLVKDYSTIDKPTSMEGNRMFAIIVPKKN